MSKRQVFFIDESGTTNLNPENLDRFYPVFVLGGVLFTEEEYEKFDRKFRDLKVKYFGTENYVLHNAEIKRPAKFGIDWLTKKFKEAGFRRRFYFDLENLIKETDFKLIACGLQKWVYIEAWKKMSANVRGEQAEIGNLKDEGGAVFQDPYLICLERILERALVYVNGAEKLDVYPEKITRSVRNDPQLKEAIIQMQELGIETWPQEKVRAVLGDFKLVPKKDNESGHQLIDLLLGGVGRKIMGKLPSHSDNSVRWEVIAEKIYQEDDLVVMP